MPKTTIGTANYDPLTNDDWIALLENGICTQHDEASYFQQQAEVFPGTIACRTTAHHLDERQGAAHDDTSCSANMHTGLDASVGHRQLCV